MRAAVLIPVQSTSHQLPTVNLTALLDSPLTDKFKGIPGNTPPFPLGLIAERNWNVLRQDLPLPLAVIKRSALDHNSRWMQAFVKLTGVKIAPHGKTTMSPQLFARQMADGAWGMTFATTNQVRIAREYGVSRIMLANQLVGPANIAYILGELAHHADFDFYCLVDSVAGVEMLAAATKARSMGRPLQVLIEMGVPRKRCGCRTVEEAVALARIVKQHTPYLSLRGVEGFEGSISAPTPDETAAAVLAFAQDMGQAARQMLAANLFGEGTVILSAGGSAYFDQVVGPLTSLQLRTDGIADPQREVIIRSGCYLTHDSIFYRKLHEQLQARFAPVAQIGEGLRPALEVWAYVQSRPEPDRVILTCGKRDISFDLHLPTLEQWYRPCEHDHPQAIPVEHVVAGLNDQHCICTLPTNSPLQVGDMVSLGISHPCTTFDRWQWLPVVDDAYNVVEAVRTFF